MGKIRAAIASAALVLALSSCVSTAEKPVQAQDNTSCVQALDTADELLKINSDALRAILAGDTVALQDATNRLKAIDNKYVELSKKCRGAATPQQI